MTLVSILTLCSIVVSARGEIPFALRMEKPGACRPDGWIRDWARTAADGYTGHLDEFHDEFRRAWTAEHRPRGGKLDWMAAPDGSWSAEGGAYWFDGLVRLAWQLDEPALKALAARKLEPVLANMNAKSVLFNWWLNRDKDEERGWCYTAPAVWQMWAAGISERPLAAWYAVTGDRRTLKALEYAFDDPRLFTEATVRKAPAAAAVFEAARLTGAPGVGATANEAGRDPMPRFQVPPDAGLAETLHVKRPELRRTKAPTRHGVTTAEGLLSVLRAYEHTGRRHYLEAVLAWFDFLDRHTMQPYGVTVCDEEWGWAGANRCSETCTVAAEPRTRIELMMLTGDGRWGDQVERAFFNAAPGCVSRDFRRHVYLQGPNRLSDNDFDEVSAHKDFVWLKEHPTRYEKTHYPLCCTAALNRLIPNYVESMWMTTDDGGVAAALYGPSVFAADVPSGRFAIREETDYPFGETIRLVVTEAPSAEIPLRLRVPGWCDERTADVNGQPLVLSPIRGFATVRRMWKAGDVLTMTFAMKPRMEEMVDHNRGGREGISILMGPLLFAWAPDAVDENTTKPGVTKPVLNAKALSDVKVVRAPMPQKWDWPSVSPVRIVGRDATGQSVELIPYGCAPLRVSVFDVDRRRTGDPTGCPSFGVELPRTNAGETIRAADYGFSVTNDDNAAALNRALAVCRERKASRLVLSPGTYRCFGPKGVEVEGLDDFTLEGNGAVLVFWRKFPKDWDAKPGEYAVGSGPNLQVKGCRRTLVRDLVCDWDWKRHPLGFFARVIGKKAEKDGESYVDFKLVGHDRYPLYPDPVPVQLIQPMSDDLTGARMDGGGCRVYCETHAGFFGSRNEWLSPDTLRVWICVAQPDRPHGEDISRRFWKGRNRDTCACFRVGETYNICHYYYGMSGMDLSACEHLTLRNVCLWSCRGHGVGIGDGLGHLAFEGFRLAPPTEDEAKSAGVGWFGPRPFTATSDGTHCRRSRGHFRFTDCEWTLNNDDCLNFHDCTTIARGEGERTLRVVNAFGTRYLGAEVGHELELLQESYEPTGWKGKIVAFDADTFTVDRPLPGQTGRFFVVYDRAYSTDNLFFRNCRFHRAAWARNLILANNVTFDSCRFESFIGSPLRFQTCYTPNVWCEGMGATNIVVRNCTFENCADFYTVEGVSSQIFLGLRLPSHKGWPEKRVALVKDETLRRQYDEMLAAKGALDVKPCGKTVGALLVERNTFVNPRGELVYAFNGDGVIVRDNDVVFDGKAPYRLLPEAGGLRLGAATDVRVYENVQSARPSCSDRR